MKSHASDQLRLAECIYIDASAKCADIEPNVRDLKTLRSRVEHEGLSFLTITLPSLGSDFDRCLSDSSIGPTHFRAFRKCGKAPSFLKGFFDLVFDRGSGRLLNEPSLEAIEGIRQIAYSFKKLKVPCSPNRVRKALDGFVQAERIFDESLAPSDYSDFSEVSYHLWGSIFSKSIDFWKDLFPKHGPGATAEKLSGNQKFKAVRWHDRLEPYFPVIDCKFANANAINSPGFKKVSIVPAEQEQPVRVIPVPKTLKGPRIIAIEPVCMQYTQQALSRYIIDVLESSVYTKGHVNFTDQSINRRLALSSSSDQTYATIDMSMASDLVPYHLAIRMFDSNPDLQDAVSACRSTQCEMPDGTIVPLRKFASMGSALCFPIEAMYFYTICIVALLKARGLPVSSKTIKLVKDDVFVYGDDIIIPTDESTVVMETLQKYYCKVNTSKSFTKGKFRESCGMDAFDGEEVTPTYIRSTVPNDKRNASELISFVQSSNLFYKRGYWKTASLLQKLVERRLGKLPILKETSPGLGLFSYMDGYTIHRSNKNTSKNGSITSLYAPEVRAWVPSPVYQVDKLDGEEALTKCLLMLQNRQYGDVVDKEHLVRSPRHGAVALKRRWISPF